MDYQGLKESLMGCACWNCKIKCECFRYSIWVGISIDADDRLIIVKCNKKK